LRLHRDRRAKTQTRATGPPGAGSVMPGYHAAIRLRPHAAVGTWLPDGHQRSGPGPPEQAAAYTAWGTNCDESHGQGPQERPKLPVFSGEGLVSALRVRRVGELVSREGGTAWLAPVSGRGADRQHGAGHDRDGLRGSGWDRVLVA